MPDIAVLLGKGKPGSEPEGDESGGESYDDRVVTQMRKLGRALRLGDFEAAAEAFRAAHEECACESEHEEPDGDESAMNEG